jgi:hypothetical protein
MLQSWGGLTLAQAWDKFNDPKVPEKQKLGYLRLTKKCNESVMQLTINGPSIMAIEDLRRRIEEAGIEIDNNNQPLILSESEQIHNYIRSNPSFKAGNEAPISYPYYDSTSMETWGHEAACPTSDTDTNKSDPNLNHNTNEYQ